MESSCAQVAPSPCPAAPIAQSVEDVVGLGPLLPAAAGPALPVSLPAAASPALPASLPAAAGPALPASLPASAGPALHASLPTAAGPALPAAAGPALPASLPAAAGPALPASLPAAAGPALPASLPAAASPALPASLPAAAGPVLPASLPPTAGPDLPVFLPAAAGPDLPASLPAAAGLSVEHAGEDSLAPRKQQPRELQHQQQAAGGVALEEEQEGVRGPGEAKLPPPHPSPPPPTPTSTAAEAVAFPSASHDGRSQVSPSPSHSCTPSPGPSLATSPGPSPSPGEAAGGSRRSGGRSLEPILAEIRAVKASIGPGNVDPEQLARMDALLGQLELLREELVLKNGPQHKMAKQLCLLQADLGKWRSSVGALSAQMPGDFHGAPVDGLAVAATVADSSPALSLRASGNGPAEQQAALHSPGLLSVAGAGTSAAAAFTPAEPSASTLERRQSGSSQATDVTMDAAGLGTAASALFEFHGDSGPATAISTPAPSGGTTTSLHPTQSQQPQQQQQTPRGKPLPPTLTDPLPAPGLPATPAPAPAATSAPAAMQQALQPSPMNAGGAALSPSSLAEMANQMNHRTLLNQQAVAVALSSRMGMAVRPAFPANNINYSPLHPGGPAAAAAPAPQGHASAAAAAAPAPQGYVIAAAAAAPQQQQQAPAGGQQGPAGGAAAAAATASRASGDSELELQHAAVDIATTTSDTSASTAAGEGGDVGPSASSAPLPLLAPPGPKLKKKASIKQRLGGLFGRGK